MERTTILVPLNIKLAATQLAKRMGISFGELIRLALKSEIQKGAQKPVPSADILFQDLTVFRGRTSSDLASNHDAYLYGNKK